MNNQVQPAQLGGQTQQATLPPLSEPSLFTADPGDLDFNFDPASGNFMLDFKKSPESIPSTPIQQESQSQNVNPQSQTPNHEDRFTRIEGALINLAGILEGMGKGSTQQLQPQNPQEVQSPVLDLQSEDFATNLVNVINSSIEKRFSALEEKLKPLNTDIAKVNERLNLTDLVTKYGPPFVNMYPLLLEYKGSDPNANIEKLYLTMSKLDSTTRTTNGSGQVTQPIQPQVDLVKKAEQMATVRDGVPQGLISETPKVKLSIAQAVDQTIKELFGR